MVTRVRLPAQTVTAQEAGRKMGAVDLLSSSFFIFFHSIQVPPRSWDSYIQNGYIPLSQSSLKKTDTLGFLGDFKLKHIGHG